MKKHIIDNGVPKYNPDWKPTTTPAVPFANQATALAVLSTAPTEDDEIVVTPMYEAAVAQYHNEVEPEIYIEGDGHNGLDELNQVLAKYEVPAGLLSKLLQLKDFDFAEIIVDDSGSMSLDTDARGPNGEKMTRWWEAKSRISQMMEIMVYVVSPTVTVRFLNRPNVLELQRGDGEAPTAYLSRAETLLNQEFSRGPTGGTPALEAIRASIGRFPGNSVLRFFLGDGVPNGGAFDCREIENLLIHRPNPEKNPFTFMSCTGDDEDVEWMKECEEKAPYCAEFDDYQDESREVLKDQGQAFPYSFGLHLVAQLVAAFNPHDLDAMDESVPFTRQTLENLLGYQSSPQAYKYYFDSFILAQGKLQLSYQQKQFVNQLPSLYEQFESAAISNDIPAAAQYKKALKTANAKQQQQQQQQQQHQQQQQKQHQQHQQHQQRQLASSPQDECCIIL